MKTWKIYYGTQCGLDGTGFDFEIEVEDNEYDILMRMLLDEEVTMEERDIIYQLMSPLHDEVYEEEFENFRMYACEEDEDTLRNEFSSIFVFDYLSEENLE